MNKKIAKVSRILSLFFITTLSLFSQSVTDSELLNNELEYEVRYYGMKLISLEDNLIEPSKYLVSVEIPEHVDLDSISYDEWLALLENEDSDFVTNLILYECYERDAIRFLHINKDGWRKNAKSREIVYWKEFLKEE